MSEEFKEFRNKILLNKITINIISEFDVTLESNTKKVNLISILILDEKISSLIQIDKEMGNAMIDFAQQRAAAGVNTRELALGKWHETSWHGIIKTQIDKLRVLRKEFD